MSRPKRSRKSKSGDYSSASYKLQHMKRSTNCFIFTIRDDKGRICSVALRPDAIAGIPDKDIQRASKFLRDTSLGKKSGAKRREKALKTLRRLTDIALEELSQLADLAESGAAVIAAGADAGAPYEKANDKSAGKKHKGGKKGKHDKKGKDKKGKKKGSSHDKKRGSKHSGKDRKARKDAYVDANDTSLIPREISQKLGKKATKRIEKMLRSAIERELAYILEQEARKWTRLTIETAGIGERRPAESRRGESEPAPAERRRQPSTQDSPYVASTLYGDERRKPDAEYGSPCGCALEGEAGDPGSSSMLMRGLSVCKDEQEEKPRIREDAFDAPSAKEQAVLEFLRKNPTATQSNIAQALYISRSTVADYTASLQARGLLAREGSRRAGHWVIPV